MLWRACAAAKPSCVKCQGSARNPHRVRCQDRLSGVALRGSRKGEMCRMASGCASGPLVLFAAAPGALARALPDTLETCLPGLTLGPLGCVLGFARVAMPRVRHICKLCAECCINHIQSQQLHATKPQLNSATSWHEHELP